MQQAPACRRTLDILNKSWRLTRLCSLANNVSNRVGEAVGSYLTDHDKLYGVMVHSKDFSGWEKFGGFTAHMHFVRARHQQIPRVAVVTDSPFAPIAESLGKNFTDTQLRHFAFAGSSAALDWLKTH